MRIAFIGTGYVGLVSGVMMSHLGHEVTCIDTDFEKIRKLQKLESPIFEPGLDEYLQKYGNGPLLHFVNNYDNLELRKQKFDAIFITVGTPSKEDGSADLSYIFESANQLIENNILFTDTVLVIKSTVPPGTCNAIRKHFKEKGLVIDVVSNPEFLREGAAVGDFMRPDRIVVGIESEHALHLMNEIYKPLTDKGAPLVITNLNTSELIKYAANSFLANKIAFINEMANLCEAIGANVDELSIGVGFDKRIGKDFLKAGPGFGGSCFPKDILALQHLTHQVSCDSLILDAVVAANNSRAAHMVNKISDILHGDLKDKNLAIMGLSYKAGTDDIRSSPAIKIIEKLKQQKANIKAYDPKAMGNISKYFENLVCSNSPIEAAENADAIIVVTEWPEFKDIDFAKLKSVIKSPIIVDLRSFLDAEKLKNLGYEYHSIGKK